jgi:putative zinc finger protein
VTQTIECPEARISLGVYVLGAIDPAERAQVEGHLATCRDCRDELAGLAALPALLARVTTEEALALAAAEGPPTGLAGGQAAPPELLGTVIDLTAARRRRRRWREASLAVAAALIVAVGVFGGLRLGSNPAPSPIASGVTYAGQPNGPWRAATTSAGGMSATVSYRSMGWGTQLAVEVHGIPVGTSCQLWVIGPDGHRTLAGGWVTDDREGTVWYPGSAGVSAGGVHGFQIAVGGTRTLHLSV